MNSFYRQLFFATLLLLNCIVVNAQSTISAKVFGLDGAQYKYGKLYLPQGKKYRIAMRPSTQTTIGVYRSYVDGSDIYLSKLDVQGGYFWIDATEMSHALIVRSTSGDDVVAEVVSAEQDAMMAEEDYYYFDKSEARKNRLNYCVSKVPNETLLTSSVYNTKSIYVMANPARNGLAFALLEPVSSHRDLNAGSLYILAKKTSSARQLNVIWEDETDVVNPSSNAYESAVTGVDNVAVPSDSDAPVYSLDGRRLNAQHQAPVFIRNGRVFVHNHK